MPDEDRRYLILGEDGRHVGLGRAPDAGDTATALAAMQLANIRGWLVSASGSFHARAKPVLTEIAPLNSPMAPFALAVKTAGGKVAPPTGAGSLL